MFAADGLALPRFALQRGDASCMGCHLNPTGGGLRSLGGEAFSINDLPMWKRGDKFSGQISDGIRIGGDYRSQLLMFSEIKPLYSEINKVQMNTGDTTKKISSFHSMSLAFEMDVQATSTLHVFIRYDALGTAPTEGWAILHFVHTSGEILKSGDVVTNSYVKLGSFLPAFGVRFDDHSVYIKGGTGSLSGFSHAGLFWYPGYRDVGAELGALFFDHVGLQVGIFNGSEKFASNFSTDPSNNKAIAMRLNISGELIEDALACDVGFSNYMHNRDVAGTASNMLLNAVHLGIRAGPVSMLGEYDFGKNVYTSGRQYMAKVNSKCIEATVRIGKGLDGILRYETYHEEDATSLTGSEVKYRFTIGAQWFPIRFLEIRPEYRIAKSSAPYNDTIRSEFDESTFLVQTHIFF